MPALVFAAKEGAYVHSFTVQDGDIDALGHITRHDRNAFGEETTLTRYARASGQLAGGTGLPLTLSTDQVRAIADSLRSGEDRQLRTEYDALGRAVRVIEPETFVFDSGSNTYATVGKTTTNRYDAMGDLVQVLTTQGTGQTTAAPRLAPNGVW